jgi:pimeloyl-ACP methyl ester carboxylesterase
VSHLTVPGASLYYEVTGSGPVLLMIAGGTDDARDYADVAPLLADAYTVVTYDCRGNSRSRPDDPSLDVPVEVHADDAHRLLLAVGEDPAFVFGNSSGAQIGLALTAVNPGGVHTVVAHEPPAAKLLPDGDPRRELPEEVHHLYRQYGVGPAIGALAAGTGLADGPAPESPQAAGRMQDKLARMGDNVEFFLAHTVLQFTTFLPDIARLGAASSRVVVAVGEGSAGQFAHDAGLALADRLGTGAEPFPGGHSAPVTHPTAFARKLREVLRA